MLNQVELHKPEQTTRLGLVLNGAPATVESIAPGALGAQSGKVWVGQVLLAVNGVGVDSHEDGTAALKATVGSLKLTLSAIADKDELTA